MTPLAQAEQAVLGAVLLEPRQLGRTAGWLRPEHFEQPAHAALYAAMLTLRQGGHPATKLAPDAPVPLAWLTDIREEASHHTRGITAAYVHSLVPACPRPAHAPVYGRMVLEGAIHRSVTHHAHRLHQATQTDVARGSGVEQTLHQAQILHEVLDDLAHRWGSEARPTPPHTDPGPATAEPAQAPEEILAAEEFLLHALTAHPGQLSHAAGRLRPEDFADPGHRQIYRALGALHHRDEPVDQLTVLWECQRRGALTDGTLEADRVRRLCDSAAGGTADHYGQQVLDSSLLRTAAASARQVGALAHDESLAPGQLISHALHTLIPLDEIRRRAAINASPEPKAATTQPTRLPPAARVAAARARTPTPRVTNTPPSSAATPSAAHSSHPWSGLRASESCPRPFPDRNAPTGAP